VAIALSLFSKFPAYTDANAKFPGSFSTFASTPYGRAVTWWLEHPFQSVPVDVFFPVGTRDQAMIAGSVSHCEKLTFRAFIPLVNQMIGGGVWTLVVVNHLAAILTFFLSYRICLRVTADAVLATASTWGYAVCWAGAWGFNDVVFGDAVAIALLLAGLVATRSWLIATMLLAAGFTDERALCAAPLVAMFHYWEARPPFVEKSEPPNFSQLRTAIAPVLIGILTYGICRIYGTLVFKLHTGRSMMATVDILLYHFYVSYPVNFFRVFEFLWVFPVLLLFDLWGSVDFGWRSRVFYSLCLLGVFAPALMVWDMDRSLCYFLPGVLVAICFSSGTPKKKREWACVIFAVSLFWMAPNESWLRNFVF
jgi:hypothetical protein